MKSSSSKTKVVPREPEKFPALTMSPCKITALPTVKGVAGLSISEIKNDLKELLPPCEDNDTDSDSSMLSDDILDSVYPVQPRSAPRTANDTHGFRYQDYSTSGNNVSVDEALFLIKDISKSHKALYDKEKEREEYELCCQALDMNLEHERGKFLSTKQEQENYLKLVQGLYARMVRLYSTYSRQNALLHTVYTSLHQQREAEHTLAAECAKLKALPSASGVSAKTATGASSSRSASTPLLKVHLQKSNIDVVLQVGQSIPTPLGAGVIAQILPEEYKLVIQLPFGLLCAHLPRAVSWCATAVVSVDCTNTLVQTHSVHGIQQHYEEVLQNRLTLPSAEVSRIHALLAQSQQAQAQEAHTLLSQRAAGEEDLGATTDNDDASVEGSEMEDGTANVSHEAASASSSASEVVVVAENEKESAAESEAVAGKSASASGRRNVDHDHHSEVFMSFNAATVPARTIVKKEIEAEVAENFAQYLLQTLPLAFAPAASLPYVAAEVGQTFSTSSAGVAHAQRLHGIEYDTTALQGMYQSYPALSGHAVPPSPGGGSNGGGATGSGSGSGSAGVGAGAGEDTQVVVQVAPVAPSTNNSTLSSGGQAGSSSSLAWQGDLDQLKGSLKELGNQIQQLEAEQNWKIAEIERLRSKSAQLTAAAAATRLTMFTRRLAHRTNLSNRGIVLAPAVPVMAHQNKSRSGNSNQSRGHSSAHLNNYSSSSSSGGAVAAGGGHMSGQGQGLDAAAAAMAGAAALLLAAGEGRSSRSKRTANQRTDDPNGDNFGSIASGGMAQGLLRATTDSPVSTHSLADRDREEHVAPMLGSRAQPNSRRSRAAAGTFNKGEEEPTEGLVPQNNGNKRQRGSSGRKAAEDILTSAGNTQEDDVEAEENGDADSVEAPAASASAAARKKPKRRRY